MTFEKRVELEHKSFIDAYIPGTRTLTEQKSLGIDLDKPAAQSDGTSLTPFQQAMRYNTWLPYEERPRWVVVSDFASFRIHDMERPRAEPEVVLLEDLPRDWRKLAFLADAKGPAPKEVRELAVSVQAGELVGKLYEALEERYVDPDAAGSLRSLNVLCVRIVFLLYAEDAGLFPKGAFHGYLAAHRDSARRALMDLFDVLDQRPGDRDPYLDEDLAAFPYVDGGLFAERGVEVPRLDDEVLDVIIKDMSEGFDWSGISPTIFGAVFESTLNPETRRGGGMHYTSIENIHRVIDPLFLDKLKAELDEILAAPAGSKQAQRLRNYQKRLASLTFLDPACGSGNFLTETYLSLRRLENRAIEALAHGQISFAFSAEESPIRVSIGQFYGIEINGFAVAVARTALWIAEAQMMEETRAIVQVYEDVLPLKDYDNIREGNALRLDWGEVVPKERLNYIMGNPPFCGRRYRT
ncbi:MAG: class I SAM-dependent DNA methyltransferase, partial [Synergistaceae bacterium]|nr:class I SAM-dependent DNA methyltransferase [Synergistaceae bacterium]